MDDGYLGNARLKRTGTELSYTKEQVEEILKNKFRNLCDTGTIKAIFKIIGNLKEFDDIFKEVYNY